MYRGVLTRTSLFAPDEVGVVDNLDGERAVGRSAIHNLLTRHEEVLEELRRVVCRPTLVSLVRRGRGVCHLGRQKVKSPVAA